MFYDKDTHNTEEQLKRQKSALRLNVQSIDKENNTGVINDYKVSLDGCSCRDYFVRRLPCKHMYRLAHEVGVFTLVGKVVDDKTVKNFKEARAAKKEFYESLLQLPEQAQILLYEIVSYQNERKLKLDDNIKEQLNILLNAGIVELIEPTEAQYYYGITIKDLRAIAPEAPKGKKAELIEYLRINKPEVEQEIKHNYNSKFAIVSLAPQYEEYRVGIQRKITPYKGMSDNDYNFYIEVEA